MSFSIKHILQEEVWGMPAAVGIIKINNFSEFFVSSLIGTWNANDYEQQWKTGIKRLKTDAQSCLVVSVQNSSLLNVQVLINWWILYKVGDDVFIQNKLFSGATYSMFIGDGLFTPSTCYGYIPARRSSTVDGRKISEWCLKL